MLQFANYYKRPTRCNKRYARCVMRYKMAGAEQKWLQHTTYEIQQATSVNRTARSVVGAGARSHGEGAWGLLAGFGYHPCGLVLNGPLTALCARLKRCRDGDTPLGGKQTDHMCRTEQPPRSPQSTQPAAAISDCLEGDLGLLWHIWGSGRKCGMYTDRLIAIVRRVFMARRSLTEGQ